MEKIKEIAEKIGLTKADVAEWVDRYSIDTQELLNVLRQRRIKGSTVNLAIVGGEENTYSKWIISLFGRKNHAL